jgi:transposase
MLTVSGLKNYYFLPDFHDMRCKAPRVFEIIRGKYHRDPSNGDVYVFMSKNRRRVKVLCYEKNAYHLYEKTFKRDYHFVRLVFDHDVMIYKMEWKSLVAVLETPIISTLRLDSEESKN